MNQQPRKRLPHARGQVGAFSRARSPLLLGVALALLLPVAAAAGPVTFMFKSPNVSPRNNAAKVTITVGNGAPIEILIPKGASPELKRDVIYVNLFPTYGADLEKVGTDGLTINNLAAGTKVKFEGTLNEGKDIETARRPGGADIEFPDAAYASVDGNGDPAVFTAGIVTDLGELSYTLAASAFPSLTGSDITQRFFDLLSPDVSAFGASIVDFTPGDTRLRFVYDLGVTNTGGVVFGVTADDGTAGASATISAVPEPSTLALLACGLLGVGGTAATSKVRRRGAYRVNAR